MAYEPGEDEHAAHWEHEHAFKRYKNIRMWAAAFERGDDIPEYWERKLTEWAMRDYTLIDDLSLQRVATRLKKGLERRRQQSQAEQMLKDVGLL